MRSGEFFAYARERYSILLRRQRGDAAPWTKDAILQAYRFCNVFREDDRTTIWVREKLREPLRDEPRRLFRALVVFRYLNRIETGEEIRRLLLSETNQVALLSALEERLRKLIAAGPILGGAYMIKTPLRLDKVSGLMEIWRDIFGMERHILQKIKERNTLEGATHLLSTCHYCGPFMAYEIVTDLRHTPLLGKAHDIMTWANPGPGAMRGAGRVLGVSPAALSRGNNKDVSVVMDLMRSLLASSGAPKLWPSAWPAWEMRDVEHTLCEFDKYERAVNGEGRPKQTYKS